MDWPAHWPIGHCHWPTYWPIDQLIGILPIAYGPSASADYDTLNSLKETHTETLLLAGAAYM